MSSIPLDWRSNLRGNLVLWPDIAPNIAAIASSNGATYDEAALLSKVPVAGSGKAPTDTRTVRNTMEILSLVGLAYKDDSTPPAVRLTPLGVTLFSFLGLNGSPRFVNAHNRELIADAMIRGLSIVIEYRAIWKLMRSCGDRLSNEELNRSMACVKYLEDIPRVARRVLAARATNDPTGIGARFYNDQDYADPTKRTDQRKAMNPLFLLAGGGWLFMSGGEDDGGYRRLEDWAIPLIDRRLLETEVQIHADTDPETVSLISEHACVPINMWMDQ